MKHYLSIFAYILLLNPLMTVVASEDDVERPEWVKGKFSEYGVLDSHRQLGNDGRSTLIQQIPKAGLGEQPCRTIHRNNWMMTEVNSQAGFLENSGAIQIHAVTNTEDTSELVVEYKLLSEPPLYAWVLYNRVDEDEAGSPE